MQHGYGKIILEVDSEILMKWITANKLQQITTSLEFFQCKHSYREASFSVDYLLKLSHTLDITQHFYTYNQLATAVKGSYILEQQGMKNFERKKLKRIKKPL
ncbi:hypothetical protein H5410_014880 [Solanum commersonii]|uniref:RNase H type-1 domain-containing protein n=1 Tax=Solanum commersonii TaxID=4109 RepID=A0A9J5ZS99_SOLCO|nr:hypothetical protein H5410_014880 [Solanum commersonii]